MAIRCRYITERYGAGVSRVHHRDAEAQRKPKTFESTELTESAEKKQSEARTRNERIKELEAETRRLSVWEDFDMERGFLAPARFGCELKSMQVLPPDLMAQDAAQAPRSH